MRQQGFPAGHDLLQHGAPAFGQRGRQAGEEVRAGHFPRRLAEARGPYGVDGEDAAVGIEQQRRFRAGVEQGVHAPLALAESALGALALGDVLEHRHHAQHLLAVPQRRRLVLDGEGRAILAPEHVVVDLVAAMVEHRPVDRAILVGVSLARRVGVMGQGMERPADQLPALVAEHGQGRVVDEHRPAVLIEADDALRRRIEDHLVAAVHAVQVGQRVLRGIERAAQLAPGLQAEYPQQAGDRGGHEHRAHRPQQLHRNPESRQEVLLVDRRGGEPLGARHHQAAENAVGDEGHGGDAAGVADAGEVGRRRVGAEAAAAIAPAADSGEAGAEETRQVARPDRQPQRRLVGGCRAGRQHEQQRRVNPGLQQAAGGSCQYRGRQRQAHQAAAEFEQEQIGKQ